MLAMMLERYAMNNTHDHTEQGIWRQTLLPSLSLFTSLSTLICCALPALLVTIGLGAALAGLISIAPWLTVISEYKMALFAVAGVTLCLSTWLQWQARKLPCPIQPNKAKACQRMRRISWWILGSAWLLYAVGFFFAFLAVYLL